MLLSKQRMKPFLEPLPIKKKTHPSFLNCSKTFLNKKLVGYVAMLQSPSLKKILIRKTKRTLTWKEQNQQKGFGNKHVVYRNRNIRQSAETVKKKKRTYFLVPGFEKFEVFDCYLRVFFFDKWVLRSEGTKYAFYMLLQRLMLTQN